jgi:hypothetical protein
VELEVVRNAAHLFVLLEDALVGDPDQGLLTGAQTDPKVAAIARGEMRMEEAMSFAIGWHYKYWWCLRPEAFARVGTAPVRGRDDRCRGDGARPAAVPRPAVDPDAAADVEISHLRCRVLLTAARRSAEPGDGTVAIAAG